MQPAQAIHPKLFVAFTHAVGVMAIALTVGGYYLLVFQPLQARQRADDGRGTQLKRMLEGSIVVRREHVQLKKKLEMLSERVRRSRSRAPERSLESTFLADASRIARNAGIEIGDFQRGHARHLPTHSELDITLSGFGAHAGICEFLDKVEELPLAKRVTRFAVETDDDPNAYPLDIAYTLYFGLKQQAEIGSKP